MQAVTGWSRYEGERDEDLEGHVFAPVSGVDLAARLYQTTSLIHRLPDLFNIHKKMGGGWYV